jgi:FkbM family methyltransferase
MNHYSQNNEDIVIQNYFNGFIGRLLSIGENDGVTLSNARALIELGWEADLVEPSPSAYSMLEMLYKNNDKVSTYKLAIANKNGTMELLDMASHLGRGDTSLLSTLIPSETKRWIGTQFTPVKVKTSTYKKFTKLKASYDFISIDAEGMDLTILQQIDFLNVKCVCVEYNNDATVAAAFRAVVPARFKEIYRSLENIIYAL